MEIEAMTFSTFMKQYQSTGREKLDGYSPLDFEGMTKEELKEAESLLIHDAEQLDTTAFQGLSVLKSQASEDALRRIVSRLSPPSFVHLRAVTALYEITQEDSFQMDISNDLEKEDKSLFQHAVIALARTNLTPFLYKIMKQIALESSAHDESIVHSQACGVLTRFLGFPPLINDQNPYRLALQRKLHFADKNEIDTVLNEMRIFGENMGYIPYPTESMPTSES